VQNFSAAASHPEQFGRPLNSHSTCPLLRFNVPVVENTISEYFTSHVHIYETATDCVSYRSYRLHH